MILFFLSFNTYCCETDECGLSDFTTSAKVSDFETFKPSEDLHFNNRCSELNNDFRHAHQSFALFKSTDSDTKNRAFALAEVKIGWTKEGQFDGGSKNGIYLSLHDLNLQSVWKNADISVALKIVNEKNNDVYQSDFYKNYTQFFPTKPIRTEKKGYHVSSEGDLTWSSTSNKKDDSWIQPDSLLIKKDKIKDLKSRHRLQLLVKNIQTGELIVLQGPDLDLEEDIEHLLDVEKPTSVVAYDSFISIFQNKKGSLFDFFNQGFRYDRCRRAKSRAKTDFQNFINKHSQ